MCSVDTVINQCGELLNQGKCAVLREIVLKRNAALDYKLILEALDSGDEDVREALKECGEYLGLGIANLINIFNPQKIIINGGVLLTSDFLYKTAISEANKRAYEQFINDLKFEKVNIGMEQAIRGISLYVSDKLFELTGPDF